MRPAAALVALSLLAGGGCEGLFSPVGLALTAGATGGRMMMQDRGLAAGIDDNAIALGINEAWLGNDPAIFRLIDTTIHEGRVLLTGSVQYPPTRVQAVRLAWTVPGVKEVIDEIEVTDQRTLLDAPADAWISAQLRAALVFDAKVNAVNYVFDTVNRTVYLLGIARSQDELDTVLEIARGIGGVARVVSHVRLKSEPVPTIAAAAPPLP
ncbi:MAG: BON domain-containing protein [Acetobacteraceae bacterium]|nr:BON domain-containing protein [Acetobacteraceae bacterium]